MASRSSHSPALQEEFQARRYPADLSNSPALNNNNRNNSPQFQMRRMSPSPSPNRDTLTRHRRRSVSVSGDRRPRRRHSRSPDRHRHRHHRDSPSISRSPRSRSRSPHYQRRRSPSPMMNRGRQRPEYTRFKRDPNEPVPPGPVLGVFGLSLATTEKDLENIYKEFGPVEKTALIIDRDSGKSRGFGFIYFDSVDSASMALEKTNGMTLDGKSIRVDYSVTKRPHSPTPGLYMGFKPGRRNNPPYRRHRSPQAYRGRSRSPRPFSRSPSRRYRRSSRSYSRSTSR